MSRKYKHTIIRNEEGWGFRVKYPDGELSADFYNLTRAKHHAAVLTETERRSSFERVSTAILKGST